MPRMIENPIPKWRDPPFNRKQVMTSTITDRWSDRLTDFSERNAGRLVDMELIRHDLAAQSQVRRLILSGADYDPQDERVAIMLTSGSSHFTHMIDHVKSVYMLLATPLRGDMLTVEHDGGQTVVIADPPAPSCFA
jgi:hypothetical protein